MLKHFVYILGLLCLCPLILVAQSQYVFQSESPIANFAWDENDTTRYEGHCLYENAYCLPFDRINAYRKVPFGFCRSGVCR